MLQPHTVLQDLRYGVRILSLNPGFTVVAAARGTVWTQYRGWYLVPGVSVLLTVALIAAYPPARLLSHPCRPSVRDPRLASSDRRAPALHQAPQAHPH